MSSLSPRTPVTAVVYRDGCPPDALLAAVATELGSAGLSLAGVVEKDVPRPGRSRCDMILEDLFTGEEIRISEDRGEGARGCRLQVGELMRAMGNALRALDAGPDLLVVNKFGKTEGEGGGFRPLIAAALERSIPVLIAVPARNLDAWRTFAGDMSTDYAIEDLAQPAAALCRLLGHEPDASAAAVRAEPFGVACR